MSKFLRRFLFAKKIPSKIQGTSLKLKNWLWDKPTKFAVKRPVLSFILVLLILLGLIILSSVVFRPTVSEIPESTQVKTVSTYKIGTSPRLKMQAQIEKSGVIKITALGGGVVQNINVTPGQEVAKGATLVSMSTNYQGGNAMAVSSELAALNYKNVKDTFELSKDLIKKQREVAEKTDINADELRSITDKSLGETRSLIGLNNQILDTLNQNLNELNANNIGGVNDAAILATRQQISQFQAGNNQLQSGLRSAEFQAGGDKAPAQLSDLQREIAVKQLEIQDKALDLNKEVSRLNMVAAQIQAATMYPAAPFAGKVERIHVRVGESVSPGTTLITISGNSKNLQALVFVTGNIARNISKVEESTIIIGDKKISVLPSFVAIEATDNNLYAATFPIPQDYSKDLTDKSFLEIEIPVGAPDTSSTIPFVPLDSVFQTQDKAYLFVVEDEKAISREVQLGTVLGRFVEVKEGLKDGDQVILDRNVVAGEKIQAN